MKKSVRWMGVLSLVVLVGLGVDTAEAGASVLSQYENTPPATLRAYAHLFGAYAIAWLLLFFWVLRIALKLKRLSDD